MRKPIAHVNDPTLNGTKSDMDVECDYNITKREITIAKHLWKGWCVLWDGKDTITDVPMTREEAEEFARKYALRWGDRFAGVELEGMQKKG